MKQEKRFNIRVYGLLVNPKGEVLLSQEEKGKMKFCKFPGGGLEHGEGSIECLIREFQEETGILVRVLNHYYTTDFYQESAFRKEDQLISIYYLVASPDWKKIKSGELAKDAKKGEMNRFYWKKISQLDSEAVSFPIDRLVLARLIKEYQALPS